MLSRGVVRASITLQHALGDCASSAPAPTLPCLTCGAGACADRLAHMLNVWCGMPAVRGPAPGDGPAWMEFLQRAHGPHARWLAHHWVRCVASQHAWGCWWVALMRAADFLNIPHLYWAMMREVHLRCDDLGDRHWAALFGRAP